MNEHTIEYYNTHAAEFIAGTENADMGECRRRFLQYLKPGQKILDAGCGSGRDVIAFRDEGYDIDAFDASEELVRLASEKTGIKIKLLRFEELEGEDQYNGIWACASLLHVMRSDLPDVLLRLHRLLMPDGVLYVSFKYGSGERVKGDRYFYDLDEAECTRLLTATGYTVLDLFITGDVREGRSNERWVNAVVRK